VINGWFLLKLHATARRFGRFDPDASLTFLFVDRSLDCAAKLAAWKCNLLRNRTDSFGLFSERNWAAWCIPRHLPSQLFQENVREAARLRQPPTSARWPTTGLTAVRLATLLCAEVHTYGMSEASKTGPYSYYRQSLPRSQQVWHNFSAEHALLDAWEEAGVGLPPYSGPED
jgi:hypothetical protein